MDTQQAPHPTSLLLEEWKHNVALYIDQDKRGFARMQMFILIQGALLATFRFCSPPEKLVMVGFAVFITCITLQMSRKAHKYIELRIVQGMLIEGELKRLIAEDKEWKTSSGIITTFSREEAVFDTFEREWGKGGGGWLRRVFSGLGGGRKRQEVEPSNDQGTSERKQKLKDETSNDQGTSDRKQGLKGEIGEMDASMARRFLDDTNTMGHATWLEKMHHALVVLWIVMGVVTIVLWVWPCSSSS